MNINQALTFFENLPKIKRQINALAEVGLGYIKLGQQSTTLSGGESQRVKLASELSKKEVQETPSIFLTNSPQAYILKM